MQTIKFHTNQYVLPVSGVSSSDTSLSVSFIRPEDSTFEQIEADVTGAERIELLNDGTVAAVWNNYTILNSLSLEKDALIGGQDENLEDLRADVYRVSLTKADITDRISALEASQQEQDDEITEIQEVLVEG